MSDFYEDMKNIAGDLFEEFKQGSVTYVELTRGTGARPDLPGTPREGEHSVNATVRSVSSKYVDGTHVVQTDLQASFANTDFTPTMDGFMKVDDVKYKIVRIIRKPAAGVAVSYTIIMRR